MSREKNTQRSSVRISFLMLFRYCSFHVLILDTELDFFMAAFPSLSNLRMRKKERNAFDRTASRFSLKFIILARMVVVARFFFYTNELNNDIMIERCYVYVLAVTC